MLYSELFGKTIRQFPKDSTSINAKLLARGSFVDQLMSGSYTLMPLGLRVVKKIEGIIREEMNAIGSQEVLMPLMHPKAIWNETGRWETARKVMYQFEKDGREYALSFTHEEIVLDLVRKHAQTYRDFPIKIYHFSTKFRNEKRAKSGVLRGREFLMKDLYSLHTTKADLDKFYGEIAKSYLKTFKRIELDAKYTEAAGGVFTKDHTHEFQVLAANGEDTIYYCDSCEFSENVEITKVKKGGKCPKCKSGSVNSGKSIEVGNIFRFGSHYSEKMNVMFTDQDGGKKPAFFGSYGIGTSRLLGAIVEVHNNKEGIVWPKSVAPFDVHLINLESGEAESVYDKLVKSGLDVLWDDREISAGEKFADADLIGIPFRLVVSKKVGKGKVEIKARSSEKVSVVNSSEVAGAL